MNTRVGVELLGVILLCTVPSPAKQPWLELRSRHFEIFTNASAANGRECLKRFEQIRHVFETRAQKRNLSPLPVRIFVFKTEADFQPFQVHESAAGYYHGGPDRDYIAMLATGAGTYRVVFHEYVHLVFRHAGVPVPVWFNEGTAELYSTLHLQGSQVKIGDLIPAHILTLRNEKMLDIETLMNVDHSSPYYNERGKTGIFYAQSWALVHMLNFSPAYQPGVANFIEMLLFGEPHKLAFRRAFGKSETDVLADLAQYIRRDRFQGLKLKAARLEASNRMDAAPVEESASELLLADLLTVIRRTPQARAIYDRLAALPERDAATEAGLGELAMRLGLDQAASLHFQKAIAAGTEDGRVYFDYAMLLRETGQPHEDVLRHLRKAVELDASLFEAQHFLGYLSLRDERYAEAIGHLRKATELQPARAPVWEYLALAYHYSGDRKNAIEAAQKARRMASNAEEAHRMDATLQLIESARKTV